MFENSNREVIKEIAGESMKSHKLRNLTAVMGIALTTLLITMICTVGINFYNAINLGTELTPGPLADGGIRAGVEKYEEIRDLPQVEWTAYVRPCNIGNLHNREMAGIKTALLAPRQEFYERNKVSLLEGKFPEKADEIIISDTMAERLGGGVRTGDQLILHPVVQENGQQVEKEITVTVSGIMTSPLKGLASVYEEIYTSAAFLEQQVPQMQEEPATVYVKFKAGQIKDTIAGELYDIAALVGAAGVEYKMDNGFTVLYLLAVLMLVLVVMFCGYLLIYNIFYISIVNDIRFFGMLKTIGTTAKQIRTLLTWQVARLSAVGIAAGLILGWLVGLIASPVVMARTNYAAFYKPTANPFFFISAVFFSVLTVYISSRKSYRLAMRISPVEAAGYRERNGKKKKILSAVSFALSGIIFLVVFTLTLGYNVENMVDRYHTADIRIQQDAMIWDNEEVYQPISPAMEEEISRLPFIRNTAVYYQARRHEPGPLGGCEAGYGQIRFTDEMQEEFERCLQMGTGWMNQAENGDILLNLWGIPAEQLYLEAQNVGVLEGSLDAEKFATGKYVIYNQGTNLSGRPAGLIHAGQLLHFSILDPDTGEYVDREAEVLAVVERINPFATGLLAKASLAFSDGAFREIYSGYEDMITIIQADGGQGLTWEQYEQVKEIVKNSFNFQISMDSRLEERRYQSEQRVSMIVIGLFLSGVFGMIGICNVVNTLVTGVLSRKLEFAAMQSVGMTKKQMCAMIGRESLMLSGFSMLAAIPAGLFSAGCWEKQRFFFQGFPQGFLRRRV